MFVATYHRIHQPDAFWAIVAESLSRPPKGVQMLFSFPSEGGAEAIAMWHGPSVEAVRAFVDPVVAAMSESRYFPVDAARARGISALRPDHVPALKIVGEPQPA